MSSFPRQVIGPHTVQVTDCDSPDCPMRWETRMPDGWVHLAFQHPLSILTLHVDFCSPAHAIEYLQSLGG